MRVFICVRPARDASGAYTSNMSWVDVALDDPTKLIGASDVPILPQSRPGTFDYHGMMPACVGQHNDRLLLYYCGWLRLVDVPYAVSIGIAVSKDGGNTFARLGDGPMFSRTLEEPFQENSPFVLHDGDRWHLWYGSGDRFDGTHMEAMYVIKHAWSTDGIEWHRDGIATIPPVVDYECQARPMVVQFGRHWAMWFCYRYGLGFRNRDRGYRIGFAWSEDLVTWHRDDSLAGLDVSPEGWDSEMVCYPLVFRVGNEVYMYYNGNAFGEDGFGCARLLSAPDF